MLSAFVTTEQTCLAANTTNAQTAREGLVTAIKSGKSGDISAAIGALSAVQLAQETCCAAAAAAYLCRLTAGAAGEGWKSVSVR